MTNFGLNVITSPCDLKGEKNPLVILFTIGIKHAIIKIIKQKYTPLKNSVGLKEVIYSKNTKTSYLQIYNKSYNLTQTINSIYTYINLYRQPRYSTVGTTG